MMNHPEINIAKRLIQRQDLKPGSNIFQLTRRYASVNLIDIPYDDIDGISLNIKVPHKTPSTT